MKIIHIFLFSEAFCGRVEKCNQVILVKQQEKTVFYFFSFWKKTE